MDPDLMVSKMIKLYYKSKIVNMFFESFLKDLWKLAALKKDFSFPV